MSLHYGGPTDMILCEGCGKLLETIHAGEVTRHTRVHVVGLEFYCDRCAAQRFKGRPHYVAEKDGQFFPADAGVPLVWGGGHQTRAALAVVVSLVAAVLIVVGLCLARCSG